jgi:quercetin 2,3-dioxygenase
MAHRLRPATSRGRTRLDWLDSWHSFSFGGYRDRLWDGYRGLLVLNDDIIAPGRGFGTHPHHDMEILTWMLDGTLRHGDSLANQQDMRPGDIQRMSAGTGIRHSEVNPSAEAPARLLQIWIRPDREGHAPRYDQLATAVPRQPGRFHVVAHREPPAGALSLHANAALSVGRFPAGVAIDQPLDPRRGAWLHVARGRIEVGEHELGEGDALAVWDSDRLPIRVGEASELLLIDLA